MVVNVLLHVQTHVKRIAVLHVVVNVHRAPDVLDAQVVVPTHVMKVAMMNLKVVVVAHVSIAAEVAVKDVKAAQVVVVDVKAVTIAVWVVLVVMNYVQACA